MKKPADPQSWKHFERRGWNRNASNYEERAGRMTVKAIGPMLERLQGRPGERVLDVCCGPGYRAGTAAARGAVSVGIDIAPGMVDEARRRFPDAEFRVGDAEELNFPDAVFDAVICAFGLLHLPDPDKAIGEAFRVLIPGGLYVFSVWCEPGQALLLGLALKALTAHADMTVPLPPAPPMFRFSDRASAEAAIRAAGFRDAAAEEVPIEFRGNSPKEVFDWFDKSTVRTMALFRLQTPEVQDRIRADIVRGAEAFLVGGEIVIPCPALVWHAQKPLTP